MYQHEVKLYSLVQAQNVKKCEVIVMTSITSVANCIENHYQSQCVSGRFVRFLFENNNHYQYIYLKKRYNSKKGERKGRKPCRSRV